MSDTALVSFLPVSDAQAKVALAAMKAVAAAGAGMRPADRDSLAGAARHVFYSGNDLDFAALTAPTGEALAQAFGTEDYRRYILQLIAVMAFVDGKLDNAKLEVALQYAAALGVTDDYVRDLAETAKGHSDWVKADMSRNNAESIRGLNLGEDFTSQFLPYDKNPDPALADRFRALASLPYETFGRAFYDHYTEAGYKFPGEPDGLSILFGVPHDSAHVVSAYGTSVQGEVLVSTFTAAMHRSEGMSGHILPVIFSWHLGIALNPLAGSAKGAFDAEKFWRAWERGRMATLDTFGPDWDFWGLVNTPLDEIRSAYNLVPLDAAHAADGTPGPVRPWKS
ncbi:MAG TPA: hypothetical protein VGG15_04020 [Terriglobales bacterium]|jgi:hypothetical protein